jgi:hypothetical protein
LSLTGSCWDVAAVAPSREIAPTSATAEILDTALI